jgi:hypothetical protein
LTTHVELLHLAPQLGDFLLERSGTVQPRNLLLDGLDSLKVTGHLSIHTIRSAMMDDFLKYMTMSVPWRCSPAALLRSTVTKS